MLTDRRIHKALRTLTQNLRADEPIDLDSSFLSKTIPTHLHGLIPDINKLAGTPILHLDGQAYSSYQEVLNLLLAHRRGRYLSNTRADRKLTELLWSLCCEIALDDRFKSTSLQRTRIHSFMADVHIADKQYEAIVQIHGLSIQHRSSLDDVEMIRGSPTLLREWDLWSRPWRPQWRGQTIAKMTVYGGTIKAARHRALARASMICDELRIAFPSTILDHIEDWQVAFQPGWHAIRGNGKWMRQLGQRDGRLVQWGQSFDAARDFLKPLYKLRSSSRSNIQQRVELAVRWFGMSWNDGTPWAMKFIALFAGLEALLIKGEREPRKGAILAIRHTLLSIAVKGEFTDPAEALSLYYARSGLVHGADSTAEERDYLRAFSLASEALENYIAIANQHDNIKRHSKLLDQLADVQSIEMLADWITQYRPWKYKELLTEIDKLIN